MPSNFDRETIHHSANACPPPRVHMTLREFVSYVEREAPDMVRDGGEFAVNALRRSYESIAPFDVDKPSAYVEARTAAIDGYRARRARVQSLADATRRSAPAHRGAIVASMPDSRMGAGDDGMFD